MKNKEEKARLALFFILPAVLTCVCVFFHLIELFTRHTELLYWWSDGRLSSFILLSVYSCVQSNQYKFVFVLIVLKYD